MAHVREVARKTNAKFPHGIAYEVHWREGNKKMQQTFPVKRVAERFALKIENVKASGDTTKPLTARGEKFADVAEACLAASTRLKPGTVAQYRHILDHRVLPRFGNKRISAITGQEIEGWIADMIDEGLAPNSIHNAFTQLNKTLRYALRHRMIAYSPADGVELPRNERSEGFEPVFLSIPQLNALLVELGEHKPFDTLVMFAALTGLRASEIAGLRVRDVNLAVGEIEVRQTYKRIDGQWTFGTPKSKRSVREVPILDRGLALALKKLLVAHPNSGNRDALFWPGRHPRTHGLDYMRPVNTGSFLRHVLRPAAVRAKLPATIRFHDLRHTYASVMFATGFKPYEVSRWMGHASVSTTDGIYAHLYPNDYNEQIARFEAFVAEA